jgi:predicted CopG family antitoxin
MPKEGYKSITVSEEVYDLLQKKAEKDHRSVPETIEHLIILSNGTTPEKPKDLEEKQAQEANAKLVDMEASSNVQVQELHCH